MVCFVPFLYKSLNRYRNLKLQNIKVIGTEEVFHDSNLPEFIHPLLGFQAVNDTLRGNCKSVRKIY